MAEGFIALLSVAVVPHTQPHRLLVDFQGAQVGPIELRASRCGDGIGAYLTQPVQAGDVLFEVPTASFLSLSTALSHPRVGAALKQLWESSDDCGVATLAGLLAHMQMNSDDEAARPLSSYLRMLPASAADQDHVLWWSDAELALLSGTSAYDEAVSLRKEADAACHTLLTGALAVDVARHGKVAVAECVRGALVSVMSRGYGVMSSDGLRCKVLVPLLDALNHDESPTVIYEFTGEAGQEGGSGGGRLVARSMCAQDAGEELRVSYGDHPDVLFALHYGFVPPPSEARICAEVDAVRAELLMATSGVDDIADEALRIANAARSQLDTLERSGAPMVAQAHAPGRGVRPCCVALARALRQSEAQTLERLVPRSRFGQLPVPSSTSSIEKSAGQQGGTL